ncbi:unnamed protein product [Nyctereutes procyonoides]|uniref:(raccoon dog) hypothetical protein n=1 Tax=Nyctereutes procyonoides TaxID=34880 RepID=A0A811YKP6_NYCPR|nr:unnamed protein product [Nyctereutes procyonoides]
MELPFFNLFIYDSHRERERGRDIGRGRSRLHAPGARCGIRSRLNFYYLVFMFNFLFFYASSLLLNPSRMLQFDTVVFSYTHKRKSKGEITVSALVKITDANMDIIYKDMVTKMQQEVTIQQIMSQIANVKKDMIILEKSEFSALRAENEKINVELHRLKQQIMDEVIKVRTDTKLDFNLEKSRVKELYSLNERKLLEMRTEMVALHAHQDQAVTQTDRKIDTEVAGLKTMLESHKLDNIKYLAGSVFTGLTVALGFYRLWI